MGTASTPPARSELHHILAAVLQVIKLLRLQVLQLQLMQDEQHAKHQRQIVNLKDELAQLRCTHLQCVSSLRASKKETLVNCLPPCGLVLPAPGRRLKADPLVHPFFLRHDWSLIYCNLASWFLREKTTSSTLLALL